MSIATKSVQAAGKVATAKSHKELDTTVDVVTPENIEFQYQVAGPFRRMVAYVLDLAILFGTWFGFWIVAWIFYSILTVILIMWLSFPPQTLFGYTAIMSGIFLVVLFCSFWSYGALFETYWSGQTPGKWMLGIRVVSSDGQQINGLQAFLRNVMRLGDSFPLLSPALFAGTFIGEAIEELFLSNTDQTLAAFSNRTILPTFMVGFITMILNRRFRRIGDFISGTMVVIEQRSWLMGVAKIEDTRTPQLAALLPPKFQVSRELAHALATYVERRRFFSIARRREIARHLGEPLLEQLGMPPDTSHDLLLCAIYYRTFVADRNADDEGPVAFNVPPAPVQSADGVITVSSSMSAPTPTMSAPTASNLASPDEIRFNS